MQHTISGVFFMIFFFNYITKSKKKDVQPMEAPTKQAYKLIKTTYLYVRKHKHCNISVTKVNFETGLLDLFSSP